MLVLACGAGLLSTQVMGQSAVMADIAPCMSLEDNAARYACYDKLEAGIKAAMASTIKAVTTSPEPAPKVLSAPEPPQAPAVAETSIAAQPQPSAVAETSTAAQPQPPEQISQPIETFGRQTPAQAARVLTTTEGDTELRDTIVSMQEREPTRWLFTLASGQVWYQVNSQRINLRKGDEVRIFPSPIGNSWRMGKASGKEVGFVQVKRIQ